MVVNVTSSCMLANEVSSKIKAIGMVPGQSYEILEYIIVLLLEFLFFRDHCEIDTLQ